MFKHLLTRRQPLTTRLPVAIFLGTCLVLLVASSFRQRLPRDPEAAPGKLNAAENEGQRRMTKPMVAEALQQYLQHPGEDLSLIQPGMTARTSKPGLLGWIKLANATETESEEREKEETRGDRPDEAVKFRSLQLQDEHGVIPADGLQKAREQMNVMRAAEQQRARAAGKPSGIEVAAIAPGDWEWLGPGNIGGRIRSIVIDSANANNMWVGSVSGGIWYSPNAGNSWGPVSDFMANLAVSSMVIDPTNSSIMYAGTGEGLWPLVEQVNFIDAVRGNGIFKSTDRGVTWNLLLQTNSADPLVCPGGGGVACPWSYVNRLAISPDGSTILAATVAGIYRSTDGGANWTLRPSFGGQIFDIDFDPTNSQKAIVAQAGRIGYSIDGGQGWIAASYSTDGGATFNATITGRAEVAYAPSNPSIVYASVDDNTGDFYKSVDGGKNYIRVNTGTNYFASGSGPDQGAYDNALWVNPQDATFVIVGGIDLWRSTDSGTTFTQISNWQCGPGQPNACAGSSAHADQHMIIAHPAFSNAANKVVYFGNDGGLFRADDVSTVSLTSGWNNLNHSLGITQFFGAASNSEGKIIAGAQDNGNSLYTGNANAWTAIGTMSGDGGFCAADPTDPNYLYGEYTNLQISRSTDGGTSGSSIFAGIADAGSNANFAAPFILDPNDANTMLAGGISLWRSNNVKAATPTWTQIKPPAPDGLIPPSNVAISAIAVSPNNSDLIVIGDNAGRIYLTFDGTGSNPGADGSPCSPSNSPCWSRIDTGVPGRYVTRLVIDSTRSPNWIYATLGGFSPDNVYRTTDFGGTWTDVTGAGATGLPNVPVRSLVINPVRADLLYVGTEVGIFASEDAGATWHLPQDGPANVSVDDLIWLKGDLVAVTHGRGLFKTGAPVYGFPLCVPPIPACDCFGDWDCPCTWNLNRVPTLNDDIAIICPVQLKPGLSSGGSARNMVVYGPLTLDNDFGAAQDVLNFGRISSSPGSQIRFGCRNLFNSSSAHSATNGIIQLREITATGNVDNAGLMDVGFRLQTKNLTTILGSQLFSDVITVSGDLDNDGSIEARGTGGINVRGDVDNSGSLKAPVLGIVGVPGARHDFSGSGVWQFGAFPIPGGVSPQIVSLVSNVTFDIADFNNNGTLDLRDRTLNFTGSRFQSVDGAVLGSGIFRFTPSSGNALFASSTTNFPAGVTIASGTVEYQSGGSIGVLTVDPGATLAMNFGFLTVNNDIVNNGTITRLGSSTLTFNGQTFTNNGSVGNIDFLTFNNSGVPKNQFIAGPGSWTPQNVNIGNGPPSTGTVTLQNNVTFASNQLLTSTGSALDVGNKTLTLTGPMNFFGGRILGTGLVKMQPIGGTASITGPLTIDPALEIASGTIKGKLIISNGKLKIDSGATLSLYDFGVDATGDVENNGTINVFSDSPSLRFKGSTFTNNGIITGPVAVNFGNFVGGPFVQNLGGTGSWAGTPRLFIDSSSTTTLLSDVTYDGGNLFVEGRLNTGAFTLSLPCNVIWSGAGDVIGSIRRTNLAACPGAAIAFGNPFTTIQFTSGTPPTDITVNVVLTEPAGFLNAAKRTYLITPTGGAGYTATLRLHYLDSELNGNSESTLQLWRNNGSNWTPQGVTNRNTTQNWVEYNNVTQFSPWTISSANAPTAATATISGRITTVDGTPLGGALITLDGSRTIHTITNNLGQYRFENVETHGFYTVTPARANYSFSPQELSFSLLADKTDAVFTAVPTAVIANPLDSPEFFVRQQYLDFLDREPDRGGFEYWSEQINHCDGDPSCIRNQRIGVSNAFFFELEYQQTGAYVYRLYRAAFGNNQPFRNPDSSNQAESHKLPSYAVFARDRALVIGGSNLAQNQLDLANAFVGRAEFLAKYPASQDGPAFVDAVLATIGNDTGADLNLQRTALINLFDTGGRGAVLYRLADDDAQANPINNRAFIDAEYNRAFVATQYFGYLRRDSDIGGFLFWLGQVNNGPLRDTSKQHAMVCAFITSAEYQERFSSVVTHSNRDCP